MGKQLTTLDNNSVKSGCNLQNESNLVAIANCLLCQSLLRVRTQGAVLSAVASNAGEIIWSDIPAD